MCLGVPATSNVELTNGAKTLKYYLKTYCARKHWKSKEEKLEER